MNKYVTIVYKEDIDNLNIALKALEQIHNKHAKQNSCINCPCVPEDPVCFCTYNILKTLMQQASKYKITKES